MKMSTLVTPLHIATINGRQVRFFKAPSGQPEMPWHAVEDLYLAVELPRPVRRHLTRSMRTQLGSESATVATADGPVVIASHRTAQAFLGAVMQVQAEQRRSGPDFENEYCRAGGDAMKKLTGDLPPAAMIAFVTTCFRNTHGTTEGTV